MRHLSILALFIIGCSVYGLFEVKFKVQNLKKDVLELERQIAEEKDLIHVLKAEWAYLNNPERLKKLSEKYLQLDIIKVAQMRSINADLDTNHASLMDLDQIKIAVNDEIVDNNPRKLVKWNYKRNSENLVQINARR